LLGPNAGTGTRGGEGEATLKRTDSLRRVVALIVAALTLLCGGLLVGVAEGQGGGKVTVLSTQQHAIRDAGALNVEVKGGSPTKAALVEGLQSGGGAVQLTDPAPVDAGKSVMSLPLTSAGRTTLSGCSIAGLRGRMINQGKDKGDDASGPVTELDRDLAVCSV